MTRMGFKMSFIYTSLENEWVRLSFALFAGFLMGYLICRFIYRMIIQNKDKYHLLLADQWNSEIERLKITEEKTKTEFQQISKSVLDHTNQNFIRLAKSILDNNLNANQKTSQTTLSQQNQVLSKFSDQMEHRISQFDQHIRALEVSRAQAYQGVVEQLNQLNKQSQHLSLETKNLGAAFKSNQTRGRWGEIQLKRVCELSGMLEHCDFDTQVTIEGELQSKLRPDMLIRLPDKKFIIVDAKAPLEAYLKIHELTYESEIYQKTLKEHGMAVKKHINALSTKSYQKKVSGSAEFVVMFLPGEGIFSAALRAMPDLLDYAVERNILLSTPTTLIALLRTTAFGWQQTKINQNAKELVDLGKIVSTHLAQFSTLLTDHSKSLNKTNLSFNKLVRNVNQKLIPSTNKIALLSDTSAYLESFDPIEGLVDIEASSQTLESKEKIFRPKDSSSPS